MANRPDDAVPGGPKAGRLGRIHDRVVDVVAGFDQGAAVDRVLSATFQRSRDLGSSERREVTETVYGVVRGWRRLEDRVLRAVKASGKKPEIFERTILLRMIVLAYLAEQGQTAAELQARDAYVFRRVPGMFERLLAGKVPEAKVKVKGAERALGLRWSLPDWFARRLIEGHGEARAEAIAGALSKRAPLSLRVNAARATRDEAAARILAQHGIDCLPAERSPLGLIVPGTADVEGWPIYREGAIEIQDEGSQLAAFALGAQAGERVLDACAGAGGKTLAIGAAMNGSGQVVACDMDPHKLDELRRRARRAGLTNVEPLQADLLELPERLHGWADRVMADVPCTGSGRFRRQPDARWRVTEADLEKLVPLQMGLLSRAIQAARPGGVIVYATCSVLREENEAIVERVLGDRGDVRALSVENIGPGPSEKDPDGFFVATLERIEPRRAGN